MSSYTAQRHIVIIRLHVQLGRTFSKLLRKILGRFLILGQSLTISGKTLARHSLLYWLIHDLTTTSHNYIQQDIKIKVLIAISIALLSLNSRLVLCQIFFYDFPKIRNLPKIFLKSFENVAPSSYCNGSPWPQFLPARRYASAGYRDRNVSVCPSVCHAPVLCQNEES